MPKITSSADLDDIEAGRVVSAEDAKEMFRKKYPGANI